MDTMNLHLSFFEAHIEPYLREDTNASIGGILIALAYPQVILIGPPPLFADTVVDVATAGFWAEPDAYPLFRFLSDNPAACEKIVNGHEALAKYFRGWAAGR